MFGQVILGEVDRVLATLLDGLVDLLLLVDQRQCLDDVLVRLPVKFGQLGQPKGLILLQYLVEVRSDDLVDPLSAQHEVAPHLVPKDVQRRSDPARIAASHARVGCLEGPDYLGTAETCNQVVWDSGPEGVAPPRRKTFVARLIGSLCVTVVRNSGNGRYLFPIR